MSAHKFESVDGARGKCNICTKTRNAKAHKDVPADDAFLSEVETSIGNLLDGVAARHEAVPAEAPVVLKAVDDAPAPAPRKSKAPANTVRLWVGWRITNAAVLDDTTLAAKLREAKPTSELDRYVYLTADELRTLDAVAVKFEQGGNTGPVIYSARTLRRRIAEGLDKLEGQA